MRCLVSLSQVFSLKQQWTMESFLSGILEYQCDPIGKDKFLSEYRLKTDTKDSTLSFNQGHLLTWATQEKHFTTQPNKSVRTLKLTKQTDLFMKTIVNQTLCNTCALVNSPASQHWHLCHLTRKLGRWWWTWHLQQQGCVLWLAGLPGVELYLHVCGWTAGPESGARSSAYSGRFVRPVWKKERPSLLQSGQPCENLLLFLPQ